MRKLFLCLCFMFMLHICEASITVEDFVTADDVTIAHLQTFKNTVVNAINSADGGLLTTGSVTTAKLADNANPEKRWDESFNDFVYTGLTIPTSTDLISTTVAGTAYIEGVRVVKDATAKTYTASKHTYVDLSKTGTYTYSEVAINASEPAVTANSIRIARVSTDSTKVLSIRDDRTTTLSTLGAAAIIFEGATDDAYETTFAITDPTADRTITFPNATFTVGDTNYSDSRYTVVSTTRDISTTGNQAITGAGFTPTAAFLLVLEPATNKGDWVVVANILRAMYAPDYAASPTSGYFGAGSASIYIITTSSAYATATFVSWDSDGMTINWSKTGSPTGDVSIYILFMR